MKSRVETGVSLYRTVGGRLAWVRRELGKSQRAVANGVGCSSAHISAIEVGRAVATRNDVALICQYLESQRSELHAEIVDAPITYALITDGADDAPGVDVDPVAFGARLKMLRELAKMGIDELAHDADCAEASIRGYERGERLPGVDVCDRISSVLARRVPGFRPEMLLG